MAISSQRAVIAFAAASPNTKHSNRELDASRFAPVQPRLGTFARRVKPGQVGAPVAIDHDAAAGIMLGGHDRDRLGRHVDAQPDQFLVDVREMALHEIGGHVADVEVDIVQAVALDLGIDRPRHHVARGEFEAFGVVLFP